ncbi:MAG: prolipoprotein diacylglyceryl transferase [Epsilonproteobacteria bacterium]|nr:prolipoprotein diacylglyceryl transferase [Campylobacterota bacterium]
MQHFIWNADPIAFSFGSLHVYWYGILFATAILFDLEMMKWIYKREGKSLETLDTLFLYIVIGIVVGARLGHCLFYDPSYYLSHPLEILAIHKGGLASHGGGLGALIGILLYKRKHGLELWPFLDRVAIVTAFFGFFVRMGNFMNSEILGHKTDVAWGIVFARVDQFARHPVQLYEALSYFVIGVVLLVVYLKNKNFQDGKLFGAFLALVFSARFVIEFFKERQAEYAVDMLLSTGQLLSIPFILAGFYLLFRSRFSL